MDRPQSKIILERQLAVYGVAMEFNEEIINRRARTMAAGLFLMPGPWFGLSRVLPGRKGAVIRGIHHMLIHLARNHIRMSLWSMGIWGVMTALLIQGKSALWNGSGRWIMVVPALAASLPLLVTGAGGGKIAGIPSCLSVAIDEPGLNIFQTFYLPWTTLGILVMIGVLMALICLAGRRTRGTGD